MTSPTAGSSSSSRLARFRSIANRGFRSQPRRRYASAALASTARSSSSRLFARRGRGAGAKRSRQPGEPSSAWRTSEATSTDCVCTGRCVMSTGSAGNADASAPSERLRGVHYVGAGKRGNLEVGRMRFQQSPDLPVGERERGGVGVDLGQPFVAPEFPVDEEKAGGRADRCGLSEGEANY